MNVNSKPMAPADPSHSADYTRRVLVAVGAGAFVVALLFLGWQVFELLLLAFAGLLLAVALRALSDLVAEYTPLAGGWALGVVLLLLAAIIAAGVWLLGGRVAAEVDQLGQLLPDSLARMRQFIGQYAWGRQLLQSLGQLSNLSDIVPSGGLLGRATGVFSTSLNLIINASLVLFVGIYLAVNPTLYKNGVLKLVPIHRRARINEVLTASGRTLRSWLLGEAVLMLTIGVLKGVGLWILGVPLALTLGVLAGILEFVPNIGPVTAGTIAALIAFTQSPQQALYVLIFTVALQAVESNILQPVVQKFAVDVPPVLTILTQVIATTLFGFAGLLVATPLVAVAIPVIRMLYVEDALGDTGGTAEGDSGAKQDQQQHAEQSQSSGAK